MNKPSMFDEVTLRKHRQLTDVQRWVRLILIIVVLIGLVVGFFLLKKKIGGIGDGINQLMSNKENKIVEVESVSGEVIKESLSNMGILITQEYSFTLVETYNSQKTFKGLKIPLTKTSFIYSYDGVVNAGIDFTAIEVEKNDSSKVITVTIPDSYIIDAVIDYDSFEVYDEKNSMFNKISLEDVNETQNDLIETAKAKALEKGILEKADKNAFDLITGFVKNFAGLKDYHVKIQTQN